MTCVFNVYVCCAVLLLRIDFSVSVKIPGKFLREERLILQNRAQRIGAKGDRHGSSERLQILRFQDINREGCLPINHEERHPADPEHDQEDDADTEKNALQLRKWHFPLQELEEEENSSQEQKDTRSSIEHITQELEALFPPISRGQRRHQDESEEEVEEEENSGSREEKQEEFLLITGRRRSRTRTCNTIERFRRLFLS